MGETEEKVFGVGWVVELVDEVEVVVDGRDALLPVVGILGVLLRVGLLRRIDVIGWKLLMRDLLKWIVEVLGIGVIRTIGRIIELVVLGIKAVYICVENVVVVDVIVIEIVAEIVDDVARSIVIVKVVVIEGIVGITVKIVIHESVA